MIQGAIESRDESPEEQTRSHCEADPHRQELVEPRQLLHDRRRCLTLHWLAHDPPGVSLLVAPVQQELPVPSELDGTGESAPNDSESARTVYTSHFSPAGPVTHTLSCVAKQQVVPSSSSVNSPSLARRAISVWTASLDSTSTPRWLRVPPWPGFSMRTSFKGGSVTAKFA